MKEKTILTVEPCLSIFKRGDDMRHCLEQSDFNVIEALKMYAKNLQEDATTLLKIAEHLTNQTVEVNADTHMISIQCSKEIAEKMIAEELVSLDEFDDEEYDEEDIVDEVYTDHIELVDEIVEEVVEEVIEEIFEDED